MTRDACDSCSASASADLQLSRCSLCKNAWYCDKEHQNAHWREHKPFCLARSEREEVIAFARKKGEHGRGEYVDEISGLPRVVGEEVKEFVLAHR